MTLGSQQLKHLERDGFVMLPSLFSTQEIDIVRARLPHILAEDNAANIIERDSGEVRTAMGLHQRDDVFARLVRHPRLVNAALQIRPEPLYVQQVKVNVKAAFSGETWQWHFDFATHHADDGVPRPLALNLHVFLDDVTEHNGPLYFIPGSHRYGAHKTYHDVVGTSYPLWVVDEKVVCEMVSRAQSIDPARGIVSAVGRKGTALVFFDTLVHGSPNNMSPWDRAIFSLILNPVSNAYTKNARPDYKHHRELNEVSALGDDCLVG